MKISTKGRYGVRVMLELAIRYGKGPVPMSAIEQCQGISKKYMHAILTSLKAAGLVQPVHGAGGGFVLALPPSKINLSEVFEALEGPCSLVACIEDSTLCERADYCATRDVWRDVGEAVAGVLSEITLEQLVYNESTKLIQPAMYYI